MSCDDEGCPHYGTMHGHPREEKNVGDLLQFPAKPGEKDPREMTHAELKALTEANIHQIIDYPMAVTADLKAWCDLLLLLEDLRDWRILSNRYAFYAVEAAVRSVRKALAEAEKQEKAAKEAEAEEAGPYVEPPKVG